MKTTTPPRVTRHIQRLIEKVVPGGQPVNLTVQPEAGAVVNECFPNVEAKIASAGGRMQCGWQIWEWPQVMVEAEFHAVWVSPEGQFVEITPKPHGEATILFVPDARRSYTGIAVDNVRMPVRDDLLICHFIKASEAIVQVMNRGECASQYGHVSVPAHEIEPLMMAQSFLGQSISSGLRDHDPCLCGSGGKYKRCHGRSFELAFGQQQ
ncbi:SEC-C domain-containing protein [Novilysobacter arseniciresistens]|nr:SEC-C domain-containing protein [Lysobacter arseniciresistens]